jgi:hypothetical protein
MSSDPLFAGSAFDDYHLLPYSPCVDKGENSLVPSGIQADLDGEDRIQNDTVDIGPYEYQSEQ